MSNLSDIGFPVRGDEEINEMIMSVLNHSSEVRCPPRGFYLRFSDKSGAEIWLQGNLEQELIGFNPHFAGKSRRRVALTNSIERDSSPLDGGFHAWANPADETADSGDYPFVFDAPDFRSIPEFEFPRIVEIQLTAFASNDFKLFADAADFSENQSDEIKLAAQSFIPTGLFALAEAGKPTDLSVVRPVGQFAGEIKEFALKANGLTGEDFYWLLIETLGGAIDVVVDVKYVPETPKIGGIVSGQFWLSGRIVKN